MALCSTARMLVPFYITLFLTEHREIRRCPVELVTVNHPGVRQGSAPATLPGAWTCFVDEEVSRGGPQGIVPVPTWLDDFVGGRGRRLIGCMRRHRLLELRRLASQQIRLGGIAVQEVTNSQQPARFI